MSPQRRIAGIRLSPSKPVLWTECHEPHLLPDSLCLIGTPEGPRSARCVVAPHLLLGEVTPLPGYQVLRPLTDQEALLTNPAGSLRQEIERTLQENEAEVQIQIEPDGSRALLLHPRGDTLNPLAEELTRRLGVPVLTRTLAGRLPDPPLPYLLQEVTYQDESVTVERISVFHGEITFLRRNGEAVTVPLQEWYAHTRNDPPDTTPPAR